MEKGYTWHNFGAPYHGWTWLYKCHVCKWSWMISFLFFSFGREFWHFGAKSRLWSLSSHSKHIPDTCNRGLVSSRIMHAVFLFFYFNKFSRNRRPTSQHQELNQEKKCAHFKGRRDPSDTKHCHVKDRACSLCSMNTTEATIGMSSFNFPFPPFRVVSCEIDTTDMYIWKWSWMLYPPECKAHI